MKVIAVAAVSSDAVFGYNGSLPWAGTVPLDMKRFSALTKQRTDTGTRAVLMGRQTWESLPEKFRPLPDRRNIVLSSTLKRIEGVAVCRSLENAIALCESQGHEQVAIIGGKVLICEAMNRGLVDEICVTIIERAYLPPSHVLLGSPADHGYVLFPELLMVERIWPNFAMTEEETHTQQSPKDGSLFKVVFFNYKKL